MGHSAWRPETRPRGHRNLGRARTLRAHAQGQDESACLLGSQPQIEQVGAPALETVRDGLAAEGLTATVTRDEDGLSLTAMADGEPRFHYRLSPRERPRPVITALDAPERRRATEWRLSAHSDGVSRPRDLTGFTRQQVVADVLAHLQLWRTG